MPPWSLRRRASHDDKLYDEKELGGCIRERSFHCLLEDNVTMTVETVRAPRRGITMLGWSRKMLLGGAAD